MAVLTSTQELTRQAIAKLRANETKANGAAPVAAATQETPAVTTETTPAETKTKSVDLSKLKNIFVHVENYPELKAAIKKAADAEDLSLAGWSLKVLAEKVNVTIPAPEKKAPKTAVEKATAEDGPLTRAIILWDNFRDMAKLPGMAAYQKHADREAAKVKKMVEELAKEVGQEKAQEIFKATEKRVVEIRHPNNV